MNIIILSSMKYTIQNQMEPIMKQTTTFAQSVELVLQNLLNQNLNRQILHTKREKQSGMQHRKMLKKDMLTQ